MQLTAFFKELFEYSYHYNEKLIALFHAEGQNVPERSVELLSHILNAHRVWNQRVLNQPVTGAVWDVQSPENHSAINKENLDASLRILDNRNMDEILNYTTLQGTPFSNTIRDILFHIINHSTHHRAQIAASLRAAGITPLPTDYILYKR